MLDDLRARRRKILFANRGNRPDHAGWHVTGALLRLSSTWVDAMTHNG
jgi:hypothetical protein